MMIDKMIFGKNNVFSPTMPFLLTYNEKRNPKIKETLIKSVNTC